LLQQDWSWLLVYKLRVQSLDLIWLQALMTCLGTLVQVLYHMMLGRTHLFLVQVLYQYFVGVSSRQPFWKLDIPCGQVVQLVPRLFGFEERRISVAGSAGEGTEAAAGWMHMVSHWEQ
jgi:hypothetical protein